MSPPSSPRADPSQSPSPHQRCCPVCRRTLQRSYTLRGLLWAMVCFPCGMYCCMRRLRRRCAACESDVIISDGGVPTVAQTYNTFADFKWQFPQSSLRIGGGGQKVGCDSNVKTKQDNVVDEDNNGHDHDQQQTEEEHQRLCPRPCTKQ